MRAKGPRSHRWRRVRFRVRGLIGLVLVIAAVLGWIIRVHRDETSAADAIIKADGYAARDWQYLPPDATTDTRPRWRRWLHDRLGADYFQHIVGAMLRAPASDADLARVGVFSRLESLTVYDGSAIGDDGLANLQGLDRLGKLILYLEGSRVTDVGLAYLGGLNPAEAALRLKNTRVTDGGLVQLRWIKGMTHLDLSGTRITDAGLAQLEGMKGLVNLALSRTRITDVGLSHLGGLTALQGLDLEGTEVTDAGLARLRGLTRLEYLDLSDTGVTDASIETIKQLRRLDRSGSLGHAGH